MAEPAPWSHPGHDFGRYQVHGDHARPTSSSCPLRATGPTLCPFGGACHTCPTRVQAKPVTGEAHDQHEQEADRVATQVMMMPSLPAPAGRAASGGMPLTQVPPIVHQVLQSPGQPMAGGTKELMESRFGHDFGRVRIHADRRAAESARAVQARAYAAGPDIVFGEGWYSPTAISGQWLLAHELAHT